MSLRRPRSAALAQRLRKREQRNVTFLSDEFPIFWESASGATVTDADGNQYIDCTAAFGVANAGHCNPNVIAAVAEQSKRLIHGMGDVHPTEIRVRLLERLAGILPPELSKTFLATTGSEAVEAALKTAMLATGKAHFAAYRGGYHGLSFGALAVGGIERFRAPFAAALGGEPLLLEYPHEGSSLGDAVKETHRALAGDGGDEIAAIIIEPVQGRGGAIVPPAGYLAELRRICDERRIVLIVDEIYTGFGRTGAWFAIERDGVVPDILCVGKAMGSGVPISAAIGRSEIMDAWPRSTGEALHTSTYLGNPLGCAAALATIEELKRLDLANRANYLGKMVRARLEPLESNRAVRDVRGRGLLLGVQLRDAATASEVVARSLNAGVIFLQSGVAGDVITIAPPLVISEQDLNRSIDVLEEAIQKEA